MSCWLSSFPCFLVRLESWLFGHVFCLLHVFVTVTKALSLEILNAIGLTRPGYVEPSAHARARNGGPDICTRSPKALDHPERPLTQLPRSAHSFRAAFSHGSHTSALDVVSFVFVWDLRMKDLITPIPRNNATKSRYGQQVGFQGHLTDFSRAEPYKVLQPTTLDLYLAVPRLPPLLGLPNRCH